jgi:hypothetical protein
MGKTHKADFFFTVKQIHNHVHEGKRPLAHGYNASACRYTWLQFIPNLNLAQLLPLRCVEWTEESPLFPQMVGGDHFPS